MLNSKLSTKPSIWKFINVIKNEESKLKIVIDNIRNGQPLLKMRKRGIMSFENLTKNYYLKYDEEIEKINFSDSNSKHEDILNIW